MSKVIYIHKNKNVFMLWSHDHDELIIIITQKLHSTQIILIFSYIIVN